MTEPAMPGAPGSRTWTCAGETVELFADRALYWPAQRTLYIADLHLGKGDAFRLAGIALPSGGSALDLARLQRLLQHTGASTLRVLGDFLHGPTSQRSWRDHWNAWRAVHDRLRISVVTGNHDRALAGAGLDLELLGPAFDDGPFALRHAPQVHPHLHVLCGHLHPVAAPAGLGRRWPAFWLQPGMTVLPAFSRFTGGWRPPATPGATLMACVEESLIEIPITPSRARET